jgi:hypothetical protein
MNESNDLANLKKRYLLWLYKTTKEALDRIERKFTQLEIDKFLLNELKESAKDPRLAKYLDELKAYIAGKEKEGLELMYQGDGLSPEYHFLVLKVAAIEKAILKELGRKGLLEIRFLYEQEMEERILRSTEH